MIEYERQRGAHVGGRDRPFGRLNARPAAGESNWQKVKAGVQNAFQDLKAAVVGKC